MKKHKKRKEDIVIDERSMQECLGEIAVKATARFNALEEFFFLAKQEDELQANISDAAKLILMIENAAKDINKELTDLLAEHGVHIRRIKHG